MEMKVRFSGGEPGFYRGKNGGGHLTGVLVDGGRHYDYVYIYAMNTIGVTESCYMRIPMNEIPNIIRMLTEVHQDAELHRSQSPAMQSNQ